MVYHGSTPWRRTMDNDTKISFDRRELELVYAALDRYEKYLDDFSTNAPTIDIGNSVDFVANKTTRLKERVEKVLSLMKALNYA